MSEHCAFVDVSALRGTELVATERLVEESFKLQCAVSAKCRFALLDSDCKGSLLQRQQHRGCRDEAAKIRLGLEAQGLPYDSAKSLCTPLRTLYNLTQGNGIKILLAAQEDVGTPSGTNCVSVLTQLPSTPEGVQNWLQAAGHEHVPSQVPNSITKRKEYFSALYQRCQQLCGPWLQLLRDNNIRMVLLLKGYVEVDATPAERLLAYSLHLLLMSELPPGSCVCPVELAETSDDDSWELDRKWPRNIIRNVLQAAGQMHRYEALRAKVQALKLAKDGEGDKWLQQQRDEYQRAKIRAAAQRPSQPAAAAAATVPPGPDTGSPGEPAADNATDAADKPSAQPPTAARVAARKAHPFRQPLRPTVQNHQEQQPANSGSVGCPANSNAGGSRRSGLNQPAGGLAAVLGAGARRQLSAIDPDQGQHGKRTVMPGLRPKAQVGLGRLGSRVGRENSSLLPVVQLGSSQEPNSSAFTGGTGGSGRQQQHLVCSQRDLIPPVALGNSAVPDTATTAREQAAPATQPAVHGSDEDAATTQLADVPQCGAESVLPVNGAADQGLQEAVDAKQQLTDHKVPQQQETVAGTGCLAVETFASSAAAQAAVAAVQEALQQLQVRGDGNGVLETEDLPGLRRDLLRLCETASKAVTESCRHDQQQWSLGMSAAAREAVLYAKKELDRMHDDSLKELAHLIDQGTENGAPAAAGPTAGLPEPDKATVRRARLRQGLLMLSSAVDGGYDVDYQTAEKTPLLVLEPMFLLLFCIHAVLEVGPLQQHPLPPPNMEDDGTRWSAKIQYLTTEMHVDHFMDYMGAGWETWSKYLKRQRVEGVQQQQLTGSQQQSSEQAPKHLLLLGAYHNVPQWLTAEVLPGIKAQPYLSGLHALLSKWIHDNQCEEGSVQVPASVDFDSKHQVGDPAALGVLLQEHYKAQDKLEHKKRQKTMRECQKQQEADCAGEGMGTTEGVPVAAAAAAAAACKKDSKKRPSDGKTNSENGSVTRLPVKRRCTGTEVTSKPSAAATQRPSAATGSRKPAQANPLLKGMTGFPGKSSLRLADPQTKKAPKQKPKGPKDLKEVEDDADSAKRNRRTQPAQPADPEEAVTGIEASTPAEPAAATQASKPQRKVPNRFARKKIIKAEPVAEEQGQHHVEDELASLGINLGGTADQQQKAAAGTAATAAERAADSLALLLNGSKPKKWRTQPQPRQKLDPLSFLAPAAAAAAAANCTSNTPTRDDERATDAAAAVQGSAAAQTAMADIAAEQQHDEVQEGVGQDDLPCNQQVVADSAMVDSPAVAVDDEGDIDASAGDGKHTAAVAAAVITSEGHDDRTAVAADGGGEEVQLDNVAATDERMEDDQQQEHDADQQQQEEQQREEQAHNEFQQQQTEQQPAAEQQLLQAVANAQSDAKANRKRKAAAAPACVSAKQRRQRAGKHQQNGDETAVPEPTAMEVETEAAVMTPDDPPNSEVTATAAAVAATRSPLTHQAGLESDTVKETGTGDQQGAAPPADLQVDQQEQQQSEQQAVASAAPTFGTGAAPAAALAPVPNVGAADMTGQDCLQVAGIRGDSKRKGTRGGSKAKQQGRQQQQHSAMDSMQATKEAQQEVPAQNGSPVPCTTQSEQQPVTVPCTGKVATRAASKAAAVPEATPSSTPPSAQGRATRSQAKSAAVVCQQTLQPAAAKRQRKGAQAEKQQLKAVDDVAATPLADTEKQVLTRPAATPTGAAVTPPTVSPPLAVYSTRSQSKMGPKVQQEPQSAAPERQKKCSRAGKQAGALDAVAAAPLADAKSLGLTSPTAMLTGAAQKPTPGSTARRSPRLAGAVLGGGEEQLEQPVQDATAAATPNPESASTKHCRAAAAAAVAVVVEAKAPPKGKKSAKLHSTGASVQQPPQLTAFGCRQSSGAEVTAAEKTVYTDPPSARTRRATARTTDSKAHHPATAVMPVPDTDEEAKGQQLDLATKHQVGDGSMVSPSCPSTTKRGNGSARSRCDNKNQQQQQQQQQEVPANALATADADVHGEGMQAASPEQADVPASSVKAQTCRKRSKQTPAKRKSAAAGLENLVSDSLDAQEPSSEPAREAEQDKLQMACAELQDATGEIAGAVETGHQQQEQPVVEAVTPQAQEQISLLPGDAETGSKTETSSRRQQQQRKRQKRQGKKKQVFDASATGAAGGSDLQKSPADVDLENEQGEEEEEQHLPEAVIEATSADGICSPAAGGGAPVDFAHAVSPAPAVEGPSAAAHCRAVCGATALEGLTPGPSPNFNATLRAVSAENHLSVV